MIWALTVLAAVAPRGQDAPEQRGRLYEGFRAAHWPRVLQPTIGFPAIIRPGDVLTILIGANEPLAPDRCRASLKRHDLDIGLFTKRLARLNDGPGLWILEASVPRNAPCPLMYDVHLRLANHSLVQPRAVMIVPHFAEDATYIQITDTEINDADPGPSERLARAIREINLIAPDAVLATGDLTYDGQPCQFDLLVERLKQLEVPVFTQIGNADHHGDESAYFQRVNAFRDYAVDVGPVHLTALDSGTNYKVSPGPYNIMQDNQGTGLSDDQIAWLEQDLKAANTASVRLAFMHFPAVSPFGNRASIHFNRDRFKTLCERHRVALVLAGHTHVDSVFDRKERLHLSGPPPPGGPYYVQTATTSSRERAPIFPYSYRVVRIKDGRVVQFTCRIDASGQPDAMRSTPVGRLDVHFDPPNDGRVGNITATVTNRLNESFEGARLIFRTPAGPQAGYDIEGGRLQCVVPDGPHHHIVVSTSIPAQAKAVVSLRQR